MHALYYQLRNQKSKSEIVFQKYYQTVLENISSEFNHDASDKCRVCLRQGNEAIFGHDYTDNVVEVLQQNGVNLSEGDNDCSNFLCTVCFKFIQTTILFRKTARRAEELLKLPVKTEVDVLDTTDDLHNTWSDDNSTNEKELTDKIVIELTEMSNVKEEKEYSEDITCHVCSSVVKQSQYKKHMAMHDAGHKKFQCHTCDKSFTSKTAYQSHCLKHGTDFPFKCHLCPYRGRYPRLLKSHMQIHTADYKYMCTACPARFLSEKKLQNHMSKHKDLTAPSTKEYKCKYCSAPFKFRAHLVRHLRTDHGVKPSKSMSAKLTKYYRPLLDNDKRMVECKICRKVIKKYSYKCHYEAAHSSNKDNSQYLCDICGRGFGTYSRYYNHARLHTEEFQYKCELCPYRGRTFSYLTKHMYTHNRRIFQCDICSKVCHAKNNLIKHIRSHQQPMFECNICKKRFHHNFLLTRHMRAIHLGLSRPHPCGICDKVYLDRKHLVRHQTKVHGMVRPPSAVHARALYKPEFDNGMQV